MQNKMTVAIIEDDPVQAQFLKDYIQQTYPQFELTSVCDTIKGAKEVLSAKQPTIVFLDIQLKDGNSIQLLNKIEPQNCFIIFCTAFDHYAIEAFKHSAVHYLLKPYSTDEIDEAIRRIDRNPQTGLTKELASTLTKPQSNGSLTVPTIYGYTFLPLDQILYLKSDRNYTEITLVNDTKVLSSYNLGRFEKQLKDSQLIRVHQSYIINIDHIMNLTKGKKAAIKLSNSINIPVSSKYKKTAYQVLLSQAVDESR